MRRLRDALPASVAGLLPARLGRHRLAWLAVARKDVADAGRSWLLYALAATFLAFIGIGAAVPPLEMQDAPPRLASQITLDETFAINMLLPPLEPLIPLTALVVAYRSIVGEDEQGSLQVLLGLPVTRRDLFVGKLVGRSVVVVATMLLGFAVGGVIIAVWYESFDAGTYLAFVGLSVFLAVVSTAIAVGISGFARSRARAMGAAIVTFATFTFFWQALPGAVYYARHGELAPTASRFGPTAAPAWFVFLRDLKLQRAYKLLVHDWVTPVLPKLGRSAEHYGEYYVEGAQPFYLEPWFSVVVLVAWAALFLGLGYWRFRRVDLG